MRAMMPGSAVRSAALSAAVGAPVPWRAFTTLSSMGRTNRPGITISRPCTWAVNAPRAFASASCFCCAAMSSGASPCSGGAVRPWKMRGELTIAACCGLASGTLMTSMRKSAEFGSLSGASEEQPGSSLGERTPAEPET